jgi:trimethylamine-N-oxide reductase (cytochrome c)
MTTNWNDGFRFVKAVQSEDIECIVAQHPWLENDCYIADIVLPVATKFELEDLNDDASSGVVTSVYRERQSIPLVGESVSDFEAVARVAKKLGDDYYDKYTVGDTPVEKIIDLFFEGSGIAHLDVNDDFHKKDMFVLPVDPDIQEKATPGLFEFYKDPASQPLATPTGKLEFTSTQIAKYFPDDPERPPYPKY